MHLRVVLPLFLLSIGFFRYQNLHLTSLNQTRIPAPFISEFLKGHLNGEMSSPYYIDRLQLRQYQWCKQHEKLYSQKAHLEVTDTKDQAMLWMLECVNIRIFMEKVSRPKYVRSNSLSISRLWGEGTRQNRKGKAVKKEKRLCFIPAQNVKSPLL